VLDDFSGTPARIKSRVVFGDGRRDESLDPLLAGLARPSPALETISGRLEDPFVEVDGADSGRLLDGVSVESELDRPDEPAEAVAVANKMVALDVDV
jgi:hypothetical protein